MTMDYIKRLIRHYVPEWVFDEDNPDLGTAFAKAFAYMMDQNFGLYGKLMDKHYIAFLNCLRVEPPAPQSAEGYVMFQLSKGAPHGEIVPGGTILFNEDTDVPYAVEESMYVTPSIITDAYFSWKGNIYNAFDSDSGTITIFDNELPNLQHHECLISHEWAFEELGKGSVIELDFGEILPSCLSWRYEDGEEDVFQKPVYGGTKLQLVSCVDLKSVYEEGSYIRVILDNNEVGTVNVKGIKIRVFSDNITSTKFFHQETEILDAEFYPFGKALIPNDCFYIACNEAFSMKSASICVNFTATTEKFMPEGDLPDEVLKAKPIMIERLILEYWNGISFTALRDYKINALGDKSGERILTFICPEDMEALSLNGIKSRWLRARILDISNVYMSLTYEVPKVKVNNIFYSTCCLAPSSVTLLNNMERTVLTEIGDFDMFTELPYEKPTLFFGFDKPLEGREINLLVVPNGEGLIRKIEFYINSGKEWERVKALDKTQNLSVTGLIQLYLSTQPQSVDMFGKRLYWIRLDLTLENVNQLSERIELAVFPNAAKVSQTTTLFKESFTADINNANEYGELELKLKETNLVSTEVSVNGERTDSYRLDETDGVIMLDCGSLKTKASGGALEISVEYRACAGVAGNCAENLVTRMADSIGYIQYVTNPLPIKGGWSLSTAEQRISYETKKLRHRQRAVTCGDFEALAREFSGGLLKCKCTGGEIRADGSGGLTSGYIRLVYVPEDYPRRYSDSLRRTTNFSQRLAEKLRERCHPMFLEERRLTVSEAEYKPLAIRVMLIIDLRKDFLRIREETEDALNKFLDPITGNYSNDGFDFGDKPSEQLIRRFLFSLPDIDGIDGFEFIEPVCDGDAENTVYIPGIHEISIFF